MLNIAHIVSVVQNLDEDLCTIETTNAIDAEDHFDVHGTASGILELINLLQRGN